MEDERIEYQDDLSIDRYNLLDEWDNQPNLYMKWAERFAESKASLREAEENLKFQRVQAKFDMEKCKAELDIEVRNNWADKKYFSSKPTESAITSWIVTHKEYEKMFQVTNININEASDDVTLEIKVSETLEGAKIAMSHKKASLVAETSLLIGGFYSDPNISKIAQRVEEDKVSESVRKSLKRRSRA